MRRTVGFTLIELLVVIAILGALLGIGAMQYSKFLGKGDEAKTIAILTETENLLAQYRTQTGDYPASQLSAYGIKPQNRTDEGIEAAVVALFHKNWDGERPDDKNLMNQDEDVADVNVTILERPVLREIVDAWENPLVYIRYSDYGKEFEYEFRNNETQEWDTVTVTAAKDDETGSYYGLESYQLLSVGEDGIYGTEDDKTSYGGK